MTPDSGGGRPERFCIVGMGGHARSKLLPAILANQQKVAALVTTQPPDTFPGLAVFTEMAEALRQLGPDVTVLIASPPALHFPQTALALEAGLDVIIEKPAFVTANQARTARGLAAAANALVVEAFMHRHTRLHARFVSEWAGLRDEAASLSLRFLIPEMPAGTFRAGSGVAASSLYDIGCYAVSLLLDLGLDPAGLFLSRVRAAGRPTEEAVHLSGQFGELDVEIEVGIGTHYENAVSVETRAGQRLLFEPYFYGRPGERRIHSSGTGAPSIETLDEPNAFATMLAVPKTNWRRDADLRWTSMISAAAALERLSAELERQRSVF